MIRITNTISIDESELSESFVRASGPGGQNVNKVSSAVQLRFDARHSSSLPNDVAVRLMRIPAVRHDSTGCSQADPAATDKGAQSPTSRKARGQKAPRRHQKPAPEQARLGLGLG